jgi:NADPH:quinone reductase-like Zn-dependent oxidoreductase
MVLAKPKELSWVEAAALPENWMTGMSVSEYVY